MPQIDINQNLSIYYQDENPTGSPTIVLLHGLSVSSESWQLQIPALIKAGFRVISPDIRGFGKSGFVNERISISDLAKDVRIIIHRFEIAPVHLVGISLGGVITLQSVLEDPFSIGRAVLVSTFARLRPIVVVFMCVLPNRFCFLSRSGDQFSGSASIVLGA